jgi:1-deoxy-D-xylulose-5-phosphate synthase
MQFNVLNKINSPDDLKKLKPADLIKLSREIRKYIISVVSENGGHLASNLGAVELTIALHYIFNSPVDKIIWDVGHQAYTHKILTGRKDLFKSIRIKGGLSGFPKSSESIHDFIETGHSSTSISAAIGILEGQKLTKKKGKVIAVIGDGALTGGLALEALNYVGHIKNDLIIVLNDNKMSINKNVGALSYYFSQLTATKIYRNFQQSFDSLVIKIPFIGSKVLNLIVRMKKALKAILYRENLFSDFGFEYVGPVDGHNLGKLKTTFRKVREIKKPVVVHVITQKGKGYSHAEWNPSLYHGVGSFSIVDGKLEEKVGLTFTNSFSKVLIESAKKHKKITAITAAMGDGTGLSSFRINFPERFFDVGITEQHAVTFASGQAVSGLKPVVAVYSTFMQRAVDQVIHDIAIPNLPVVIAMDRAGLVGGDGETHQGIFDIALFKPVPNITFLSPGNHEEMEMMLEYAFCKKGPVLLRYPKAACNVLGVKLNDKLTEGRGAFARKRQGDVLLITLGSTLNEAVSAADKLTLDSIITDVYNLRFIKPLDTDYLLKIISEYSVVVIIEDGIVNGGIGQEIGALLNNIKTIYRITGITDVFPPHATRNELLKMYGMDCEGIYNTVSDIVNTPGNLRIVKQPG